MSMRMQSRSKFGGPGTVKNILLAISMLFACVAATVVGAAIYFSVTFGVLSGVMDTSSVKLGAAIGMTTGALGFPAGCTVFGLLFWNRLVREDGRPDRVARAIALIIGLPLALIPLVLLGLPALWDLSRRLGSWLSPDSLAWSDGSRRERGNGSEPQRMIAAPNLRRFACSPADR